MTLSGPSTEIDKVETCTAEVTHKGELTDSVTLDTALRFYTKSGSEVKFEYTNLEESSVEVTLEVYEFLDQADHKAENLSHEQRRHWDGREFDEYIVATEGVGIYGETPEEYLCRMETLGELMAVLDTCTEAQRRRFLLYALDGLTLAEIGTVCGCSKVSVYESIDAVRKKFLKFFANYPNE